MADPRNGGHPFPINERTRDKDRYPTTLPTAADSVKLYTDYFPTESALQDFALHAYPGNREEKRIDRIPWSEGIRKDFDQPAFNTDVWMRSSAYEREKSPVRLHDLAHLNTIKSYFSPFDALPVADSEKHFPVYQAKLDLFIGLRPEFTVLANYSKRCNNEDVRAPQKINGKLEEYQPLPVMTDEEKTALLKIMTTFSDTYAGPEILTRFVNPTGVMSDPRASYNKGLSWDRGINAYFSGMLQLPQMHFSYMMHNKNDKIGRPWGHHCIEPSLRCITDRYFSTQRPSAQEAQKLRNLFFEHTKTYYLDEAARLLGLGARQWGLDKPQAELSNSDLRDRMERFYRYVFSAKCLEMLDKNDKEIIVIPEAIANVDVEEAMKYPAYVNKLRERGTVPLQAEITLAEKITAKKKDPDIYKECENGVKEYAISKVLNRCLTWERQHALDFLLSDDGKGQEAVFSR